jgi:hypothetical protein
MVMPSLGVIWPMTTTVSACPGIGMNYSNIAVICRNTVVLRSMVSREGSKMASLHSCWIPAAAAAAATAPQHIVPPLAAPPLVVVCAADNNAGPSSSSSRQAYPLTARWAAGVALADNPPSARTNHHRRTACLEVVVAGMDRRICCAPFACAIPRSKAAKASFLLGSTSFGPPREADAAPSPPNHQVRRRGWAGNIANKGQATREHVGMDAPMPGKL